MGLYEGERARQQKHERVKRLATLAGLFAGVVLGVLGAIALAVRLSASTKEDFVASGDHYMADRKYAEAAVEYKNAVSLDEQFGEARLGLAGAHLSLGEYRAAMEEFLRAAELLPEDAAAQLQAARFLLLSRRFDEARTRADAVLARDPANVDAQITKATAIAKLVDLSSGIIELQAAIEMDPQDPRAYMLIGAMHRGQNHPAEAEAAFRKAVEVSPRSIDALHALAAFYVSAGRESDAEVWLRRAVETHPTSVDGHRRLAALLIATGRAADAEAPLKSAAQSTQQPAAQIALADYYLSQQRVADARYLLQRLALADGEGFAPAKIRLARIEYGGGNEPQGYSALAEVLAKDPRNIDAMNLRTQFLMGEQKDAEAFESAQAAMMVAPGSAAARRLLAELHARRGNVEEAIRLLDNARELHPASLSMKLRLVELYVQKGDATRAVRLAREAVDESRGAVAARLMRAKALTAAGDLAGAENDLTTIVAEMPELSGAHAQLGELQLRRKDPAAARRSFERALSLDPKSFDGFRGMVALDLLEGHPERVRTVIDERLKATPNNPALLALSANVYGAGGDLFNQEAALSRLVELEPGNVRAFISLASIYTRTNRLNEARGRFAPVTTGAAAVGAQTMVGLLYEAQNKKKEAQQVYERLLAARPEAAVAANNLAWLYAESGGNLDEALKLARQATRRHPDSPEFNDTLGWVSLKKGLVPDAVRALEATVRQRGDNPQFRYHLGVAYTQARDTTKAAEQLQAALALQPDFRDARLALDALDQPVGGSR
jgi:tetratricopeptide (TPR) repeat protein